MRFRGPWHVLHGITLSCFIANTVLPPECLLNVNRSMVTKHLRERLQWIHDSLSTCPPRYYCQLEHVHVIPANDTQSHKREEDKAKDAFRLTNKVARSHLVTVIALGPLKWLGWFWHGASSLLLFAWLS